MTRLDRLGHSPRDLLNMLASITNKREARFCSLGVAYADTTIAQGRLMLTVLGGLAEFERGRVRAPCTDGATLNELARRFDGYGK